MSCIIHVRDKKGRIYAFESTSYWDKEKKAPRSKRTYLGRVDENGNIIPKKVVSSPAPEKQPDSTTASTSVSSADFAALMSKLDQIETQLNSLSSVKEILARLSGRIDAFCNYDKV